MKATTQIPELEALLKQTSKRRWTDDIDMVIYDYYVQFAHDRKVCMLADYINERFGTEFTTTEITKRYHQIKVRGE